MTAYKWVSISRAVLFILLPGLDLFWVSWILLLQTCCILCYLCIILWYLHHHASCITHPDHFAQTYLPITPQLNYHLPAGSQLQHRVGVTIHNVTPSQIYSCNIHVCKQYISTAAEEGWHNSSCLHAAAQCGNSSPVSPTISKFLCFYAAHLFHPACQDH